MITLDAAHYADPPAPDVLNQCLRAHSATLARLNRLRDYCAGAHDITRRARANGLPNSKIAHDYAGYICAMSSGYLVGQPVRYQARDESAQAALDGVLDAYHAIDIDSVDAELAFTAAQLGKGTELLYADEAARPCVATVDPRAAFVVYDDSVRHAPLFGVRTVSKYTAQGAPAGVDVYVYTDAAAYLYHTDARLLTADSAPLHMTPHYFGAVPLLEFWNNDRETGDFERVLPLIDAYDLLQSDRVNDKRQFVDALLVLTGCGIRPRDPDDPDMRTPAERLREDKVLTLPDNGASAQYLCRSMTESDVDVLRRAINADIHKFSMVPDLTDEKFAGESSGVAMRYKLLGLEQLTKIKERWFREGLRQRLRMFARFLSVKGAPALDADAVTMTFTRSLPVNEMEIAQMVQTYNGIVPDTLLLGQVPFIDDVQAALDMLEADRAQAARRQQEAFGMPVDKKSGADNDAGLDFERE